MNFDPVAYDNIKYLFEGHLYDLDIVKRIVLIDRNDYINQAKWQKEYNVTMALQEDSTIKCKFHISSYLMNIASELIPIKSNEDLAGIYFKMDFIINNDLSDESIRKNIAQLKALWGNERKYEVKKTTDILTNDKEVFFTVIFERLIFEDQMEDLYDLIDVAISSLEKLQTI